MGEEIKDELKGLKIGEKIISLRKSSGITTSELAQKSGLSKIIISQIESNKVSPTVAALLRISKVFNKELNFFFDDREDDILIEIVRKNERKSVKRKRPSGDYVLSYSYQSLSYRKSNKHMQPFHVEFDIDIDEEPELLTHEGEEFLYLLNGELEMRTDTEVRILKEGDSVYFDSTTPHAFIGRGKIKPIAIVSIYTPERTDE